MNVVEFGNIDAKTVLLQPADEHDLGSMESQLAALRSFVQEDFLLAAFPVPDWNRDLSPWKAPAVFGKEDFGGEAAKTLADILEYCSDRPKTYFIGGYSLAGLFALWAAYRTDVFSGVAAASPSMWFPGFTDYMKQNRIRCSSVYLSLGNKEEKTRNPVMSEVGNCIRTAYSILKESGIDSILEWNEGNHFREADIRTAKAFAWVLEHYHTSAV